MKKAIFWDCDGTLVYGNESFKCSLMRALEELGYSVNGDDVREFMRSVCSWYVPEKDHSDKSGEEWWRELLGEIRVFCEKHGVTTADAVCNSFRDRVITYEYEAYPDAMKVLSHFKEMGYENYIISNNFPQLGEVFKVLGLDSEISGYFTSAGVGYEKPRREIFEYAIESAGNPEVKYMIGDNPVTDYQGGLNTGMTPILVHGNVDGMKCCGKLMDLVDEITE